MIPRAMIICLLAWAVTSEIGRAGEAGLPGLLDLMELEGFERSAAVLRLCRGATPSHLQTLLQVAEQPDLVARHYGQVALALRRLAGADQLGWGVERAGHEDPVVRYLGVTVVGTLRGQEPRKALLRLLGSDHADVRAAAALALRRYSDKATRAALRKMTQAGATASERACAGSALEWIASAADAEAVPARRTVVLMDSKPETIESLKDAGVLALPYSTKALGNAECLDAVLARGKAGATLRVKFGPRTLKPAVGVVELLKKLDLVAPSLEKGDPTSFICNLGEPHPLQDYVHDLYAWRLCVRGDDREQISHAASEVARWSAASAAAFVKWDRKVWTAPFCGLVEPGRACILDAPPATARGRVVLDLTGVQFSGSETWRPLKLDRSYLRLWEFGNNYKAVLQGPQSIVPIKNIYRGRYGAMKIHQQMPAPYFEVDERVATPHVPWAKPLAGGPVEVGFLMPEIMIRTAIEIRQRMDVAPTWLPFAEQFFGGEQDKDRRGPPVIDAGSALRLRRYLDRAQGGVVVIPGFDDPGTLFQKEYVCSWNAVLPELRVEILGAVRDGLGLIAIGPVFPRSAVALGGAERTEPPEELLRAVPIQRKKASRLYSCYTLGRGRIVHLRPAIVCGQVRSGLSLGAEFLVPGLVSPYTKRVSVDEYALAACCAAIHWASGRSQTNEGARPEVRLVDRFGRRREAACRTGPTIEEIRYLDAEGKVTGWAARRVGPDKAVEPSVSLDSRWFAAGEPVKLKVEATGADGDTLFLEVTDIHGRVVRSKSFPIERVPASIQIPPWPAASRWHDLYLAIRQKRETIADTMLPFTVDIAPPDRRDLCLYVLPGPTMFIPGMKHVGANGANGFRDHFLPWLDEVPQAGRKGVRSWHAHDTMVRSGLEFHESYQWMSVPTGATEGAPAPADPTAHARMRHRLAGVGPAYRALGMRRAITCDEFELPVHASFSPATLTAFRRWLRGQYGSLAELNAAWGRSYASWDEVRPDTLKQAVARKNLVSWAQHREFMETLVANWCEQADRLLQEQVPGAAVAISNAARGPDTGVDLGKLARACSMWVQYFFFDTMLPRDLGRPDMRLGYWEPVTFDQTLPEKAKHEALFRLNYYLLEQYSTHTVWWGFCDFQWPFLRPDLTPARTFRLMLEERKALQAGIDRVIMGSELDNREAATLYSHASRRTLYGLEKMRGRKLQVAHDWKPMVQLLEPMLIRGHALSARDLRMGRLDRERPKVLFLSGVVALSEESIAALEAYVRDGGRVVADVLPGAYAEDTARQDQTRIAKLFGVRGRFEPDAEAAPGKVIARGGFAALSGIERDVRPLIPDLAADGSAAHGEIGNTPALIEHAVGDGKTLLLNFRLAQSIVVGRWDPAEAKWKAEPIQKAVAAALAGWAGIEPRLTVSCTTEGPPPYPGSSVYVYRDGDNTVVGLFCDGWFGKWERTVTVRFPEETCLYDLRSPGAPKTGIEFAVTVPPWRAAYLVATPAPLPEIQAAAEPTLDGNLRLSLAAGGGRRVVIVKTVDPSGRSRPELDRELDFVEKTDIVIPVALSDPIGTWRIEIRDVVTGQTITENVEARR